MPFFEAKWWVFLSLYSIKKDSIERITLYKRIKCCNNIYFKFKWLWGLLGWHYLILQGLDDPLSGHRPVIGHSKVGSSGEESEQATKRRKSDNSWSKHFFQDSFLFYFVSSCPLHCRTLWRTNVHDLCDPQGPNILGRGVFFRFVFLLFL